jgi:signal transduction histidine kinase
VSEWVFHQQLEQTKNISASLSYADGSDLHDEVGACVLVYLRRYQVRACIAMFKSLRTSTKLLLLCGMFVGALVVATYGLVAEKQIAIDFVRKEIVGIQHLEALRGVYAATLTEKSGRSTALKEAVEKLAEIDSADSQKLDTAALQQTLVEAVDKLASASDDDRRRTIFIDVLTAERDLASRIGDDSNLTLDPDLDSYYVQDIVVSKMPTLLSQLGELQSQLAMSSPAQSPSETVRALVLDGMIRSGLEGIRRDLQASYRGGNGAHLQQALDANMEAMVSVWDAYLETVKSTLHGASDASAVDRSYTTAMDSAISTWAVSLAELKLLLNARLSNLLGKLRSSLLLNGLLVALSIAFAVVTGRHIVRPLQKLERLADAVGQTKDYKLRTDYESKDEIGRLAVAFNTMLGELEAAREREAVDAAQTAAMQTELARVARITTMGEMAASIAHEINQPLAAIVNNANASLRWLGRQPPNVERARSVLERVVSDAGRASEVIRSVRSLLEKGSQERVQLDVNELIREVMAFVRAELRHHGIAVRAELADDLPRLSAVRIQLQQVLLNLITNAVESMAAAEDRSRVLTVRSQKADASGILITVQDTGTGIDRTNLERVFEPFFSTKPEGMGMGLSICRSIIESYGGRIAASVASDGGSVFQVSLPVDEQIPMKCP